MAEVLPFECEHEVQCHESGWEFSKDCPERCTLREQKRVRDLERVAMQAYEWFLGAGQCRWSVGDEEASWMREQLEALGVSVDD